MEKKNYKDYFVILTSENSEDFSKHLIDVPLELRERTLFYNKEEFNAKYDVSSAPWLVAFNGKSEKLLYSGGYNTVKISDQRQTRYFQIKKNLISGVEMQKLPGLGCHSAKSTLASTEFGISYYLRSKLIKYTGIRID